MIPIFLRANAECNNRFVTKLVSTSSKETTQNESTLIEKSGDNYVFSGQNGLFTIDACGIDNLIGDVIVVDPKRNNAERLIRASSKHNSLLVTEMCDQLCIMCSQPPKKTHIDRFDEFSKACLLAPENCKITITGGEPTLFKSELFRLIEKTYSARPDIAFHILSNGQHFGQIDRLELTQKMFENVTWGIPLYSHKFEEHDEIVVKEGAFERLCESLEYLLLAGAKIELRTVVMQQNINSLNSLAFFIAQNLRFVNQWSIMQMESIGFAKNRFSQLYFDHSENFEEISKAIDISELYGIRAILFNFALCSIPEAYRPYCVASISDWKQKFIDSCEDCSKKSLCAGFFEWHPDSIIKVRPI